MEYEERREHRVGKGEVSIECCKRRVETSGCENERKGFRVGEVKRIMSVE